MIVRCTPVALAALLAWAAPAQAANFLLFEGTGNLKLAGQSTDAAHPKWIHVDTWSWGIENTVDVGSGAGTGVGKPRLGDFSWTQGLDASVPGLFLAIAGGSHVDRATLDVTRTGDGKSESFFQMIFEPAFPTRLELSGDGGLPQADAALTYDKVTMRYRPQDAKGGYGAWIEGSFAQGSGKVTFAGNQQVLMGLFTAGGRVSIDALPPVPEPSTYALMLAGLGVVGALARRRRLTRS